MRAYLFIEGFGKVLSLMLALAIVSLLLDRWLRLSLPTRITLLIFGLICIGYCAWKWIIEPPPRPTIRTRSCLGRKR